MSISYLKCKWCADNGVDRNAGRAIRSRPLGKLVGLCNVHMDSIPHYRDHCGTLIEIGPDTPQWELVKTDSSLWHSHGIASIEVYYEELRAIQAATLYNENRPHDGIGAFVRRGNSSN